jgi:hypothetical protein
MGRLFSYFNHQGLVINGILLGEPVEIDGDPTTFEWDDQRIPDGEIDENGSIITE